MSHRDDRASPSGNRERHEPASELRLRRIIEHTSDAIVVVDREGLVRFANPAAEELFSRDGERLLGAPFGFPVAEESTEVDLIDGRVAEMRVVELSWEGRRAWLASLRDITERKESEAAERRLIRERAAREAAEKESARLRELSRSLEQAMARLKEEDRRKDQLMAVLGHELRNPLAAIDAGLRLLEAGAADQDQLRRSLPMMRRQVRRQASLLDALVDLSGLSRGKLELIRRSVPLGPVIEDAADSCRDRLGEKHELTLELPEERLHVEADARRLRQVVCNLLDNAIKYSAGGNIRLASRREGSEALIEVSDEGSGIAPGMLESVFEPFLQGPREDGSPMLGGLGIGLALVKRLVEMHGGSVTAASPGPGMGSTFTVRLPLATLPIAAERPRAAPRAAQRLLVVDDNPDAASSLAELLGLHGYQVETANTGGAGLARALALGPALDAMLLDLDLPDTSGYELAKRLRRERALADLLIVVISGFGDEQARERSRRCGVDHHLVKPVDLRELLELLAAGDGR